MKYLLSVYRADEEKCAVANNNGYIGADKLFNPGHFSVSLKNLQGRKGIPCSSN